VVSEHNAQIAYVEADQELRDRVVVQWKDYFPSVGEYIILDEGFTIVALDGEQAVGLISVKWEQLPPPLSEVTDAYIWDIEVAETHRRRGIASRLIAEVERRAADHGAYQIRAWSAYDRAEALPMWKALGFGLCPSSIVSAVSGEPVEGFFVARPLSGGSVRGPE
jgi:GNAT superfamily N-acetyltransferase